MRIRGLYSAARASVLLLPLGCGEPQLAGPVGNEGGTSEVVSEIEVSEEKIFDIPYLMRDLDNGLRVIIVPTDYPDIVTIQIPVQTGSRNEVEPGKSGFAHFFEHMMFRGTERYTADEYLAMLKNAGADQNAYTTDDYTNYHITFTKDDLETVIELEADRFQNLSYSEEQFRTEALAVKGEYLKNYSNPLLKLYEVLLDESFTTHPYKHTTMGFFEDIEAMPDQMDYSREFFDRWYRPEKTTIILVGDLDPESTIALVEKYWGDWQRGDHEAVIPEEPPARAPIYSHVAWEAPTQPWVVFAFRGPAFDPAAKDMAVMDLIAELYFSESSELYQDLVVERRLVDQLFAYFPNRKDPNLLSIAARLVDASHAEIVSAAIVETLARVRTEEIDQAQLEQTQSRLKYAFAAQLDNSESIGSLLAQFVHFERDPEVINTLYRTYDKVTAADLLRLANRYFVDVGRSVVTLANGESLLGADRVPSIDERVAAAEEARQEAPIPVVGLESSAAPLVDVAFLFHTGAAFDPPGKKGLAALTAAMITEGGSAGLTIQDIEQRMYPMAAGFDAQVDKEMTRLAGSVHRDNLDQWYALVREQLLNPGWREHDFERLKTQTINAIRTDLVGNNDEELGKEVLYELIYGDEHPYGTLTLGAVEDLQGLTLDDVKSFYESQFTAGNVTLGLAGGYEQSFLERVQRDLQALPAGSRAANTPPEPLPVNGHSGVIVEKETPAVAVSFGFPIDLRRGDPDWVTLWLVRSWLGEHRSSNGHLYKRIREARGMNYGDYAYIEYFPRGMFQFHPDANLARQQQIFQIWLRPLRDNNDAHFATRAAVLELAQLIERGMSEEDFEATRNYLYKFVSLLTKTQSQQLGYRLDSEYYGIDTFAEYVRAELAELTLDEVNRVLRKYLQTENIKFVFITRDAEDLRRRLLTNETSPLTYNSEKPAELLAEDQVIANLPLAFEANTLTIVEADEVFN